MEKIAYSSGPHFFGKSPKKSWFDEGDRCSPGPAIQNGKKLNLTNPVQWTVGKATQRDSFLDKYHRQYPSPDRYQIKFLQKPYKYVPKKYTPKKQQQVNNKIDEGSSADYHPHFNHVKSKISQYSFGYTFQRDYSTKVPSPFQYNPDKIGKKTFNKTQRSFSIGERSLPYGQQVNYPYVGKYKIKQDLEGYKYTIGTSERPQIIIGQAPGKIYSYHQKSTFGNKGPKIVRPQQKNNKKNQNDFPSPDRYNPVISSTQTNIINYESKRSEIGNVAIMKNPSPHNYDPKIIKSRQTVSFTKKQRQDSKIDQNPGVGTYNVQKKFNQNLGNIGIKLKKLTEFVNPAPSAYDPKDVLIKPSPQKPITYRSDRVDFSKSITGKQVGPGLYKVQRQNSSSLGKMGNGPKFQPNKNKNPGPGSYEIPSGIGKLPNYCTGKKKLTTTGFSLIEIQRQTKMQKFKKIQQNEGKKQQVIKANQSNVQV